MMRNKLLLITEDFTPHTGGVSTYYANLVNQLGDQVHVLTRTKGTKEKNITRQEYLYKWIWPRWLRLLFLLPDIIKKTGTNIMWAGELLPVGTVCLILKKFRNIPYIVSVHGLDVQLSRTRMIKTIIARAVIKNADLVLTNSNFTSSLVWDLVPHAKVTVINPQGVLRPPANENIKSNLVDKYHLNKKKIIYTYARLVARKGIKDVIISLNKLKYKDYVYVISGTGPELDSLKKLSIGWPVIFTEFGEDEEIKAWLDLAEIFILVPIPDLVDVEGFGIVFQEASAFGKPIISRRVGGVPEAVGLGVIWVETIEDIALAMDRLLGDNKLCNQMGEKNRQDYILRNSSQTMNNFIDLIEKI